MFDACKNCESTVKSPEFGTAKTAQMAALRAFAQILGKLYFLQLPENLRRILLDYAQKRPGPANAAFNAAC
jgi:hypothetical protein